VPDRTRLAGLPPARTSSGAGPWPACRSGPGLRGVALRADAGYFAGALARAAHEARIGFAIGAKRIVPLWRLLAGIAEDDWHDAIDMDGAQVAVAEYCPDYPGPAAGPTRTRLTRAP
jgi:hypothetical protein